MRPAFLVIQAALTLFAVTATVAATTLAIDAGKPVGQVSPLFYGLMTEEINHSYDGGLYAELVQNRAFLDNTNKPVHWSLVCEAGAAGAMELDHAAPLNDILTNSLRLVVTAASTSAHAGVANDGYWGIPVKSRTKYRVSFYARASADFTGPVEIAIASDDGKSVFATAKVSHLSTNWGHYSATLKTRNAAPTAKARLVLSVDRPGTIWFNLVSLFPPTYHDRPNGNRIDIMQTLADMKPSFLRFPGGNYVEGDTVATRFDWKKTIGPIAKRPGHAGCWGYRSSDGLGLLEFLEWCEDLHLEPVLAVYAGYNLNHTHIEPGPALKPFVQEALDEIEYATGDGLTKWGAQRVKDGHPTPFQLHYIEIGNEDWFDSSGSYDARFAQFYDAIKAKYPLLQCISTIGTEHRELMIHSRKPDLVDEHYYSAAADFDRDAPAHWDNYDHSGPKIFVGEWAAYEDVKPWEPPSRRLAPTPAFKSALADAAWMAGMERHSDLIVMQCYAPLFVNVNKGARQWRPNLIGYDALGIYGSPSYYAIKMFSQNHGDEILGATTSNPRLHYSATKDAQAGTIYLKIINTQPTPEPIEITLKGLKSIAWEPTATILTAASADESNAIDDPIHIVPATTPIPIIKPNFTYTFAPYSITVLTLKCGR